MDLLKATQEITNIIDAQAGTPITYGQLMKEAEYINDQLGWDAVADLFEQLLSDGQIIQVTINKDLGTYGYLLPY